MGSFCVVVSGPSRDHHLCMGEIAEHGLVEKLVGDTPVETFHETILHGFARGDVMSFDPMHGCKG